jgi:transcription-repair coupling factor (superfamily II helicase)
VPEQLQEVRIEIPVDAHLPHDYVPSDRLRLEMYKRLAEVREDADVTALREELTDRYGPPPAPVDRLLRVAMLRTRMRALGVSELTSAGSMLRFAPVRLPDTRVVRLKRLHPKAVLRPATDTLLVPRPAGRDADLLAFAGDVLHQVLDPATAP